MSRPSEGNVEESSRRSRTAFAAVFIASIATCSFVLMAAQARDSLPLTTTQKETPSSVISVQSNLVLVRVVVRDGHGDAVTGLSQYDFQLFDDGKPQAIAYFSAEGAAVQPAGLGAAATASGATESAAPAGAAPGNSASQAPASGQRSTALFFDDYRLQDQYLAQTRKAAAGFVTKALSAGDQIGIFSASGNVSVEFTTDAERLQKALSQLRTSPSAAANGCPDMPVYIAEGYMEGDPDAKAAADAMARTCICPPQPGGSPPPCQQSAVDAAARSAAQSIVAQGDANIARVLAALQKLVRYMGELPGERGVAIVSDGFRGREQQERLNQIINDAILSNVTISALDAYGLVVDSHYDVSDDAASTNELMARIENAGIDADAEVMKDTAEGTGGVFIHNSNDYKSAFDRMGAGADAYYVLGFSPDAAAIDGRFHKLKTIVTTHSNWAVQARPGYFAAQPAEMVASSRDKEDADFKAIQNTADAEQQIRLSQDFLKNYSASEFAEPVANLLVTAYYSKKDWANFYAASGSVLAKYPDDVDVLVLSGWVDAHLYDPSDPAAISKLAEAESELKHAIDIITTAPRPAGLTDAQFADCNTSEMLLARRALGLIDFYRRDYADSVQELQQASTDPAELWALGRGLHQLKRNAQAVQAFEKCAQVPGNMQDQCKQLARQVQHGESAKSKQSVWTPPNVDAPLTTFAVGGGTCSLPDVLEHAGERAKDLVDNFSKFSAHEKVQYDQMNAEAYIAPGLGVDTAYDYTLKYDLSTDYDYVANLQQLRDSFLVDESRQVSPGSRALTGVQEDRGLTSLALIFHPYYQDEYRMRCEGLSDWDGTAAWVVYFVQRKDKPIRTRGFATAQKVFPEKLKGRAWFAADSYQILHIDVSLAEPVILDEGQNLDVDTVSVDYGPVDFRGKDVRLWLPVSVETFTEVARMRIVIKDTFSDFLLFTVQSNQNVGKPAQSSQP